MCIRDSPKTFTSTLKENGCTVIHVVANLKYGLKAQEAGCDAVAGEGVEAGGHNGADQITTFLLIPQLVDKLNIPNNYLYLLHPEILKPPIS